MKNPFKIGDKVTCTQYEEKHEMTVTEIDGKKIVAKYADHEKKQIIETKGNFNIFERVVI